MNTEIFWFSGTGNSYWITVKLREMLGEGNLNSISSNEWRKTPPPGRAVVVYPAFATRMHLIVQRFLRDAPFDADTDINLLADYALWRAGTLQVARTILNDRGLNVRTAFTIKMPNNYTPFGAAIPEEKQKKLFDGAEARLKEIARIIKDPTQRAWEGGSFLSKFWVLTNPLLTKIGAGEDRHFSADAQCNGCGICARICPVKNIEITAGRPVWRGHCEECFRCFQYCPRDSIQYKQKTPGLKRYHHPDVPVSTWES